MRRISTALLAATIAFATPALAQEHGHGNKHKDKDHGKKDKDRVENVTVRRVNGDRVDVRTTSKGGSPAFCRSGAGHPNYGRAWCLEKGFGLGNNRWNRATWGTVVLQPRRATLGDVLGSVILGRLTNYAANTLGYSAPLTGNWVINNTDRRVYYVRSGSAPVAEFVDTNRDGRADYVLLYR